MNFQCFKYNFLAQFLFLSCKTHHASVLRGSLRPSRRARRRPLQTFILREEDVHGGQQNFRQVVTHLDTEIYI